MATATKLITEEEFLALPEDGIERWVVNGELREGHLTTRNRFHSNVMTRAAQALANWLDQQPKPRGQVLTGDAGVRLKKDPLTVYGVDVLVVSAEVLAQQTDDSTIINGIPTLAVEILSPSDTLENINEKIDAYLEAGIPVIWALDPHRRTVTVYRPGVKTELFNDDQTLSGEPHLPEFSVPVKRLFE